MLQELNKRGDLFEFTSVLIRLRTVRMDFLCFVIISFGLFQIVKCGPGNFYTKKNLDQESNYNSYPIAPDLRIIGGKVADEGQFPYQVSVISTNTTTKAQRHICGGSILNSRWVLTARHCAKNASRITGIRVGSIKWAEGDFYEVQEIVLVRKYISGGKNDIALLKIKESFRFNDHVKPVPIRSSFVGGGENVTVSGWGRLQANDTSPSEYLQFVTYETMTNDECSREREPFSYLAKYSAVLCTKSLAGERTCRGDSGGPLVLNGELVGIVSFGQRGCPLGLPNGFIRVAHYLEWINDHISEI